MVSDNAIQMGFNLTISKLVDSAYMWGLAKDRDLLDEDLRGLLKDDMPPDKFYVCIERGSLRASLSPGGAYCLEVRRKEDAYIAKRWL